jgi:putative acetyltransferase
MEIRIDDLTDTRIQQLVKEHLADMAQNSPPESCHALGLEELRKPEIILWSAWDDDELLGCGALKELNQQHGEIKSMRTVSEHRGNGVGSSLLTCILEEAKRRNYKRISLETGSMDSFIPAQKLYAKFGFKKCEPFAEYVDDPYSLFMTKEL